jgi:sulfur-oxidizing protein SoxX
MKRKTILAIGVIAFVAAGCGAMVAREDATSAKTVAVLKSSFRERGQAKLTRLDQDEVQRLCSEVTAQTPLAKDVAEKIEKSQLALIKYPADGVMGDWKTGERIAQSGVGMQFSDNPAAPAGANCYACHQLTKTELSFGTIGPPLYNFGKVRGYTPEMQKYAYGKVYNSQAFSACSNMPRFGHMGILTEKQIRDVVALLMDPQSPVNQ